MQKLWQLFARDGLRSSDRANFNDSILGYSAAFDRENQEKLLKQKRGADSQSAVCAFSEIFGYNEFAQKGMNSPNLFLYAI